MPPPLTFRKHCLEATYMGGGKEKLNEFEIQSVGAPPSEETPGTISNSLCQASLCSSSDPLAVNVPDLELVWAVDLTLTNALATRRREGWVPSEFNGHM